MQTTWYHLGWGADLKVLKSFWRASAVLRTCSKSFWRACAVLDTFSTAIKGKECVATSTSSKIELPLQRGTHFCVLWDVRSKGGSPYSQPPPLWTPRAVFFDFLVKSELLVAARAQFSNFRFRRGPKMTKTLLLSY